MQAHADLLTALLLQHLASAAPCPVAPSVASPAVHADVCGQLPLLGGQLAAEAWGCWLLGQTLHVDLLVLTLDLWGGGKGLHGWAGEGVVKVRGGGLGRGVFFSG